MRRLEGRAAVITGASSGIGRASAVRFAAEGARLVLAGLDPAERLPGDVAGIDGAVYLQADLGAPGEVERVLACAARELGTVDVVYSNAGVLTAGTAESTSLEDWARTLAVNLTAHFLVAKHALPLLRASEHGSLLFTASDLGLVGATSTVAYCAAKGGLVNMVRALATDAGRDGTRVNAIAPGPVETPMLASWFDGAGDADTLRREQLRPIVLERFGRPEEIAAAAAFLASDDASFVTGTTLSVDGGATAWYGM